MDSFFTSTQNKNWIKTEEQLKKIEKLKIERILKRINEVNSLIKKENEEKSHELSADNKMKNSSNFQKYIGAKSLLTPNDEQILIINYSNTLIKILNSQSNKSISLKNYVISFFRRFYLKKSVLDYDPYFLMAACFHLGRKLAAMNYSLEDYKKIFPVLTENIDRLMEYEFYLCTILEYDFYVYNPYQALLGFIYTLKEKEFFLAQDENNYVSQEDFTNDCMNIIDKMYLTNIIFLYTYSEIALGSIFIKCEYKNINVENISEKLELNKVINIEEFVKNQVSDMKKKLGEIPKYENIEEEEKKTNEIYRTVKHFLRDFPKYKAQLEKERIILKNKMNDFEKNFKEVDSQKQEK